MEEAPISGSLTLVDWDYISERSILSKTGVKIQYGRQAGETMKSTMFACCIFVQERKNNTLA
jgi:hypothetical protein